MVDFGSGCRHRTGNGQTVGLRKCESRRSRSQRKEEREGLVVGSYRIVTFATAVGVRSDALRKGRESAGSWLASDPLEGRSSG